MSDSPYGPGPPKKWKKGESKIPSGTAGEYRIKNKETGEIKYIGETKDLQRRLNQHTRRPKTEEKMSKDKSDRFDSDKHEVSYKEAKPGSSPASRRAHEKTKIARHKPSWNKDRGGSGRK